MQIVHGILDNYEPDAHTKGDSEQGEPHHNWVDEVIRFEGRSGAIASCDTSPHCMIVRPRPEKKNPSLLTRYLLFQSIRRRLFNYAQEFCNSCTPLTIVTLFVSPFESFLAFIVEKRWRPQRYGHKFVSREWLN